jgi:HAD superfamily hydrolase (TIGR01509 family)
MTTDVPRYEVRAVVFDLDGVLVESEHVNVSSAHDAFADRGLRLPDDAPARIVGRHPADYVPEFAREVGLHAGDVAALLRLQDRLYRERWMAEVRIVPGAVEVVRSLFGAGVRLAIATSAGREHLAACLARFDLRSMFEVLVTKDDVRRRKPDPEPYRLALERLALAPGDAVAVEDTPFGVDAARSAGLVVLAIRTDAVPAAAIGHADLVLDGIRGVLDVIAPGTTAPPA